MSGFFVGKIKYIYPHPPLDIRILLVVESALRKAWRILKRDPPDGFDLQKASEKEITLALLEIMEILRVTGIVDGFSNIEFETITREGKLTNYNGKHPDKEPDFIFRLTEIRVGTEKLQDGIISECKPVDKRHPVGSSYCKKGLIRYINGDYAWAMRNGMMIAYVDSAYSIIPKLSESLCKYKKFYNTLSGPTTCPFSEKLNSSPIVYETIHERYWNYPQNGEKAPNITMRHLWLTR